MGDTSSLLKAVMYTDLDRGDRDFSPGVKCTKNLHLLEFIPVGLESIKHFSKENKYISQKTDKY